MVRRHEETGLIHGYQIARRAPVISHLLFADDCYFFIRATETEATVMKNILARYERLSGQAINYSKSNICFSPNTRVEEREKVCSKLGVTEISTAGKYLGMPMYVGKNKTGVFGFIQDRVGQKLQGWHNKNLSKGEMNGFWWGQGVNGKGIRWISWEKLREPKSGGGLGCRSLKNFNKAMLAKQGWRILNRENPLVSDIMQAKYFPNTDFLGAKIGANPSYMWRSIMEAQDVVKSGSRRRIGDGASTKVWHVPWLPCVAEGCLTTSMPEELKEITVQGLMNEDQTGWDYDILNDLCNERDKELITRIPISLRSGEDSWFWLLDKDGKFTVKSCYRLLQGDQRCGSAKFWNLLWSLQLPGKVIVFLWRVCKGCLPTTSALRSRKVEISDECTWCHRDAETDKHVLFDCDFARTVWISTGLQHLIQPVGDERAFRILHKACTADTRDQCVQIGMLCWGLWNRRNKWVWERANDSVFGVKAAAAKLLEDWREARRVEARQGSDKEGSRRIWCKPPQGWSKMNVDAAVFQNGSIGLGWVLRDEYGGFVSAHCSRKQGKWQAREAEAIYLREALLWIKANEVHHCIVETDSLVLANACKGSRGDAYFNTIVSDCVYLIKHLDNVLVEFVNRSANNVAHVLAKAALSESGLGEWNVTPPDFIHHIIGSDLI